MMVISEGKFLQLDECWQVSRNNFFCFVYNSIGVELIVHVLNHHGCVRL